MLHRAAVAVERSASRRATRLAAMAKRLATDAGFEVVNGCLQLHGGYGYLRDHPIERVLRDLARAPDSRRHQRGDAADRQPRYVGELRMRSRTFFSSAAARPASSRSTGRRRSMPSRYAMVRALAHSSSEWEADPAVTRVIVTAGGRRAFSAGGDLRALYDLGTAGRHDEALRFLARRICAQRPHQAFYRKPYVALIDGIVMGGGVGISVHGSHRVAGDKFGFAMPEVGIGFFPISERPGSCRACRASSAHTVR